MRIRHFCARIVTFAIVLAFFIAPVASAGDATGIIRDVWLGGASITNGRRYVSPSVPAPVLSIYFQQGLTHGVTLTISDEYSTYSLHTGSSSQMRDSASFALSDFRNENGDAFFIQPDRMYTVTIPDGLVEMATGILIGVEPRGNGQYSGAVLCQFHSYAAPTEPQGLSFSNGVMLMEVHWQAPQTSGSSGILRYEISVNDGPYAATSHADFHRFTDVSEGKVYSVALRAVNGDNVPGPAVYGTSTFYEPADLHIPRGRVTTNKVRLRTTPEVDESGANIITEVTNNSLVRILEADDGSEWWYVQLVGTNQEGWMNAQYIQRVD